jgi:hypothetical protein
LSSASFSAGKYIPVERIGGELNRERPLSQEKTELEESFG